MRMTTERRPASTRLSAWMRRTWPSRHLTDRELLETVLDAEADDRTATSTAAGHAARCAGCAARRAELRSALGHLSAEAEAAFEAAVTPERLAIQRRRILRRIERAAGESGAARILRFPSAAAPARAGAAPARRWFAAAAAAGVILGVLAVRSADVAQSGSASQPPAAAAGPGPVFAPTASTATPLAMTDEQLMRDLEEALAVSGVSPLVALDEMTPRLRDVAIDIR